MTPEDFQRYYRDIIRVSIEYTNKHHFIWPDPIGTEIHKRRNTLLYRSYSVQWHWYLISGFVARVARDASKPENRGDLQFTVRNQTEQVSFYFDDVVFNLVSMFDYLAALVGLVVRGDRNEWLTWNGLRKHLANEATIFQRTKSLYFDVHNSLVNSLSEYRSGLYHQKNDYSTAELAQGFGVDGVNVKMFIPARAVKKIKCFDSDKEYELVSGIEILIDRAFQSQLKLLAQAYDEKLPRRGTRS